VIERGGADSAVGHEHEDQVVQDGIGTQAAGILAAPGNGCGNPRRSATRQSWVPSSAGASWPYIY
jgi:hypothetical protein